MRTMVMALCLVTLIAASAAAQTTSFTYQGKLTDTGIAANGTYDMQFKLFDTAGGGAQLGSTVTNATVQVTGGIFTVQLDFGNVFDGNGRFLELGIRPGGSQSSYVVLSPRQAVTSSPYAIRSLNASTADLAMNSTQLGGVAASQYVVTTDPRMTDARDPLPGSMNYIQNTLTTPFGPSNWSINGDGQATGTVGANFINATSGYKIAGKKLLFGDDVSQNVFAGIGAGTSNTTGGTNSFFGNQAGNGNKTGFRNSFFGGGAGFSNVDGSSNTFLGVNSALGNTHGNTNVFIGDTSGPNNTTGSNNIFLGYMAGNPDQGTQVNNSVAIGTNAAVSQSNSVVLGSINGINGATSDSKVGIGTTAPAAKLDVAVNSGHILLGDPGCSPGFNGITFASSFVACGNYSLLGNGTDTVVSRPTGGALYFREGNTDQMAIATGGNVVVQHSLTVNGDLTVNGTIGGVIRNSTSPQTSANFNISGTGTANIFNAGTSYQIGGSRVLAVNTGSFNTYLGNGAGPNDQGAANSFFGANAGAANSGQTDNTFIGQGAGRNNGTGDPGPTFFANRNTFVGSAAGFGNGNGFNDTFLGAGSGIANSSGENNTFLGMDAALHNDSGNDNTFVGVTAGANNSSGFNNAFFGESAGSTNQTGFYNTALGFQSDFGAANLTHATAVGAGSVAPVSNAVMLGRADGSDAVLSPGNMGIGTITPQSKLHVTGSGIVRARINSDSNAGLSLSLGENLKWSIATVTGGNLVLFNESTV
ncbi:MAG: hypothetical protein JO314_03340, partial [Acidobacteria bacterium]|nr:hypothetical protein [Acidobacteriota bacterium]